VHQKTAIELGLVDQIDERSMLEELFNNVLPELKVDIAKGMDAAKLAKKYAALAQARVITTALTNPSAAAALPAARDILDRALGKPKETKEIQHSMANASEAEIDALIESKLKDVTPDKED